MNFKAILIYDGTGYYGWQKTRMGPSIQEKLAEAIFRITGENAIPEAASRTDRGVHAEGQTIQFTLSKSFTPRGLQKSLNAVLPPDIRILLLDAADEDFHPTLQALGKEYHYRLSLGPVQDPLYRLYAWHFHPPLDLEKMKMGAADLIGTHDFTAFSNEPEKDPICTLVAISIGTLEDGRLQIGISGNRFLYKMVRNLVGTLVYLGCGKLPLDSIPKILESRDRKQAGATAPAHGLFLHKVLYSSSVESIIIV